jgi:hypothetical protein
MRLFAIHDSDGNILEVVTSPGNSPPPRLQITAELACTEIAIPDDLPEEDADLDNYLRELPNAFRVAPTYPQPAQLMRRGV